MVSIFSNQSLFLSSLFHAFSRISADGFQEYYFPFLAANCSHDDEIDQFGRICKCSSDGLPHNCCRYRQSWSSLTSLQREQYLLAIHTVSSDPTYIPLYRTLITKYRTSFDTIVQSTVPEVTQFIPWHRYFLLEYEDLLRLVRKNLTIPYWDWSASPSSPYAGLVFDPTEGFGNASDPDTHCVTTGPYREGSYEVTSSNESVGCLTREYNNYTFFSREVLNETLSLPASMFGEFHNFVQLFLMLNVRCFVGGEMCSTNAASDPLFPLHLARLDLFVQRWQERDEANSVVQSSNKADSLEHTLAESFSMSDFCSNDELPFGACVKYAPLDPVGMVNGSDGQVLHCAPADKLRGAIGSLSEQASEYLTRTCDNT